MNVDITGKLNLSHYKPCQTILLVFWSLATHRNNAHNCCSCRKAILKQIISLLLLKRDIICNTNSFLLSEIRCVIKITPQNAQNNVSIFRPKRSWAVDMSSVQDNNTAITLSGKFRGKYHLLQSIQSGLGEEIIP